MGLSERQFRLSDGSEAMANRSAGLVGSLTQVGLE